MTRADSPGILLSTVLASLLDRRCWLLLFGILLSTVAREFALKNVTQAVVWLPSGLAVAGLFILGPRAAWAVAAATVVQRVGDGFGWVVALPAAIGSTLEALLGVLVLRRFELSPSLTRLRDVCVVLAAAAIAPLASMFMAGVTRSLPGVRGSPFLSGWDGWWRMNALGILTAVPLVLAWHHYGRRALPGARGEFLAVMAALLGGLALLVLGLAPGPNAMLALQMLLPIGLYAAVRLGVRGAVSVGSLGVIGVAVACAFGVGPFMAIPLEARHVAVQMFGLTFVAVPLVFGALIAERGDSLARWLRARGEHDALLRLLPDTTYRVDRNGHLLGVVVPDGVESPGLSEAMVGRRLVELLPEPLAQRLLDAIAAAHRGERPAPVEYEVAAPDGRREREARFAWLADDQVLCLVRDITVRKHAERVAGWQAAVLEQLARGRRSAESFDSIVRGIEAVFPGSRCALLLLDGPRLALACAPSFPAPLREALQGLFVAPEACPCAAAILANRAVVVADTAQDPVWSKHVGFALAHGLAACWSVPVRDAAGAAIGGLAVYHAAARAPVGEELATVERAAVLAGIAIERDRREGLLAAINRNVQDGIFRAAPGRGLAYANDALARMFGYASPQDLQQAAVAALADPDASASAHRRDLCRLVSGDCVDDQPAELHRVDGSVFFGLVSSAEVSDAAGARYRDGAIADVTARRQLEEQLRQAQKMEAVGKLAGGVAHDFNNLLTAIGGYTEAALERLPLDSVVRSDLAEVLRASERAATLIRQLLAFSRQQVLSPRVVDLGQIVEQLGAMLRRVIGEDVRLALELEVGAHVRVDRGQIEQVVMNLVVNARDAMPAGGDLLVKVRHTAVDAQVAARHELDPGPHVLLQVRDTGVGMSREVAARAFDPFFTTKPLGKGTGLGLSTVYGIVKQSGGAIWIDSQLGVGTTISVLLPVSSAPDEPAQPPPRPRAMPASAQGCTVLVVEDERFVRDLLCRSLERAGYRVVTAQNGVEALQRCAALERIDLLVTDIVMPELGGRELARQLTAQRPGLPVLFVSGYAEGMPGGPRSGGSTDYLQKPFTASQLTARVAALLAPRGGLSAAGR